MSFDLGLYSISGAEPSEVWVGTLVTHGSTNTCIPNFSTLIRRRGSAIQYVQDVTFGDSFKITENGLYAMTHVGFASASSLNLGISIDVPSAPGAGSFTGGIQSEVPPYTLGHIVSVSTQVTMMTTTAYLRAGQIVRAHDDGNGAGGSDAKSFFRILQLSRMP